MSEDCQQSLLGRLKKISTLIVGHLDIYRLPFDPIERAAE